MFKPKVINEITDKILEKQEQTDSCIPLLMSQKNDIEKKLNNMLAAIEQGIVNKTTQQRMTDLEKEKERRAEFVELVKKAKELR